ncbi:MAG TPA: hypothetical protein VK357_09110 [Rubrobacteraceae bacterium]|nr:hypothetical protein [Rubrobacteraceae bacterium]
MLSSRGNINPARPVAIVWGTLTGAAAPFVLIMIGLCFSIFTVLRGKRLPREAPEPESTRTRPTGAPAREQVRAVEPESHG